MPKLSGIRQIEVTAHEAKNLDTICFRGAAPLAHLALASQADIFDQVSNPGGLQRDLSPKHASDAYDYVRRGRDPNYPRAFPEIVLNVRSRTTRTAGSPTASRRRSTPLGTGSSTSAGRRRERGPRA